jgi:ABC-2 type transport system permease protein/lipopolysaccharide transport system permease protein
MEVLSFNPLFAAIDVIRSPLLGKAPLPYSWAVLLVVTVVGTLGTFAMFAKFRPRITYWI